jgi:methyltransferase (TIGR00027 family)
VKQEKKVNILNQSMIKSISSTSKTGLITLYAHSIESRSDNPIIKDPIAVEMTDMLNKYLANDRSRLLRNLSKDKMNRQLVYHIVLRTKKYDEYADRFVKNHPEGIIVNLGCGFDSRYQRLKRKPNLFIDLDLPEVINIKKEVFKESDNYKLMGQSIFDKEWLDELKKLKKPVLFIAEGLFMYLKPDLLNPWLIDLSHAFPGSFLLFENVLEKYTRGFNKKIVDFKLRKEIGVEGDVSYYFGLKKSNDLESLSPNFKFIEDWFYFDEHNPKVGWMNIMGKFNYFKYVQWTVFYRIK